jgi:hypothetical protein
MGANESAPLPPPFNVDQHIQDTQDYLPVLNPGDTFFPLNITARPGWSMAEFDKCYKSFRPSMGNLNKMLMQGFYVKSTSFCRTTIYGALYFHEKYLQFLYNYGTNIDLVIKTDRAVQFELRYFLYGDPNDHKAAMHLLEKACLAGRAYRDSCGDSFRTCENLCELERALLATYASGACSAGEDFSKGAAADPTASVAGGAGGNSSKGSAAAAISTASVGTAPPPEEDPTPP